MRVPKARKEMKLVREILHGEAYEYYPLGKYIVAAPGVCGGRPTIKYHRLDALHIIGFLERGDSPKQVARNYAFLCRQFVKQSSLRHSMIMKSVMLGNDLIACCGQYAALIACR